MHARVLVQQVEDMSHRVARCVANRRFDTGPLSGWNLVGSVLLEVIEVIFQVRLQRGAIRDPSEMWEHHFFEDGVDDGRDPRG
jgi:hypothetical protein